MTYDGAQTVVRTAEGQSKAFVVKLGLRQGSVLSPLLCVTVMEVKVLQGGLHASY